MKNVATLVIFVCSCCLAQNVDSSQPAGSNVMDAEYPRVHPDLRATVLLKAADPQKPDPFPAAIRAFRAMLDKAGIKYVYFESQRTAHEWLTGRRSLNDFTPRLFR